jgi:CubicO group peptidase (beta-lactamase class C family)
MLHLLTFANEPFQKNFLLRFISMIDDLTNALPNTHAVIQTGIENNLHSGIQIYVSRNRQTVADVGIGFDDAERPMTEDVIMLWLSAGKPLTAVMTLQLIDEGRFELETLVSDLIPEFAAHGKDVITVRHLLTHTGGFRKVRTGWPDLSWAQTTDRICDAPIEDGWVVGESAGYHVASSWFILGEIVARLDQESYSECFRRRICDRIGLNDTYNGIQSEDFDRLESRIGKLSELQKAELTLHPWHDETSCQAASPGAACRGPIRELGQFYESFLPSQNDADKRLLSETMQNQFTKRQRVGSFDQTLKHKVDFGLGVIINSNRYGAASVPYGYGRFSSDSTFGHGGSQSSLGFCDPEHGIVVAYVANTRIGEPRHHRRNREIVDAIYRDLGLADD